MGRVSRATAGRPGNNAPRGSAALLAAILCATSGIPAFAITDEEIYGALRFPRALPGARTAGMGGAGLALVEDPAASRINPARLASIGDPELLLEGRMRQSDDASGDSDLVLFDADPNGHPFAGTSTSARAGMDGGASASALGFAYPLRLTRPLVLSFSRVEGLDIGIGLSSVTRTTPPSVPVTPGGGDEVLRISRGRLDLDMELYNLAAGWRLTPTFSVGGTFVVGTMKISSETVGLLADPLQITRAGMFDPRFSGPCAEPLYVTTSDGSDTGLGFVFGSAWKPIPSLAVATAYRRGPRFELSAESRDLSLATRSSFTNVVKVPDAAAAGLAWTPFLSHPSAVMQSLTFALDLERVEYSDLLDGLREREGILTRADVASNVSYDIGDAVEVRFGVEALRSFSTWTLALRGGLYTEHDQRLHLDGITDDPNSPLAGQGKALREGGFLLPDGRTDWHATLGAGARLYALCWDLAIDLSDSAAQVVLTGVYRFGRR
ncbi:MAG TPA: hypothetical protein VGK94_06390 [Candidatus Polarisedimenticolia bacterium]|jgi:hypothetical protein